MRLDLWLDIACLFKTRSEAQKACKNGKIDVNGQPAKPHRVVKAWRRDRHSSPARSASAPRRSRHCREAPPKGGSARTLQRFDSPANIGRARGSENGSTDGTVPSQPERRGARQARTTRTSTPQRKKLISSLRPCADCAHGVFQIRHDVSILNTMDNLLCLLNNIVV